MPIERYADQGMGGGMSTADEGAAEQAGPEEQPEDAQDATVSLPMSILQGQTVKPGDVVRLEVVGVDEQDGTVSVKYASEPAPAKKTGMAGMAAEFD